jgi:hypothetical protein
MKRKIKKRCGTCGWWNNWVCRYSVTLLRKVVPTAVVCGAKFVSQYRGRTCPCWKPRAKK